MQMYSSLKMKSLFEVVFNNCRYVPKYLHSYLIINVIGIYIFEIELQHYLALVQYNHLISNVSRILSSQNLLKVLYNFPEIKL